MGVGHVQDARIAEALQIIDAWIVGAPRDPRQCRGKCGSARESQQIPAADGHLDISALVTGASVFRLLSRLLFRLSPGIWKPWPALRLPGRTPRLGRSRRNRGVFSPPP